MPKRTVIPSAKRQSAVQQYQDGVTCQAIARGLGVDFAVAKRVLVEEGVYEHGRKFQGRYSPEQKREMADLYLAGMSCGAIAAKFKCDRLNIRHILINQGVEIRTYRTYPVDPELAPVIKQRRADGLNFADIARELGLPPYRVLSWARQLGISDFKGKKGAHSHAWRGGRTQHHGYWYVRLEPSDPMYALAHKSTGYAAEHRVVMARSLGRLLQPHETVHHVNGDKADNRLENLQLRTGRHGKGAAFVCADCGSHNVVPARLAEPNH